MASLGEVVAAILLLLMLTLAAKGLRRKIRLLERLLIPTPVIAGLLGLCLGPQVVGRLYPEETYLSQGIFPPNMLEIWRQMPAILVSFIFAGIFIGKEIPSAKEIWRQNRSQFLFGSILSFGQYAVGFLAVLLLLKPYFNTNPLAGALIEIGFSGGHGTAAGLGETFSSLEFSEGQAIALGLATVGLVGGLILGTIFINYAVRSESLYIAREAPIAQSEHYELTTLQANEMNHPISSDADAADPLTLHLGLVSLAIILGQGIRLSLICIERYTYGPYTGAIIRFMPLFPMAMIGGLVLQKIISKLELSHYVSRPLINRISGFCLDLLIISALATLSISSIRSNWQLFVVLATVGLGWTAFSFWVIAPRIFPDHWFEKAIADFGQGTGMVASGLLLLRLADPQNRTGAVECFAQKQLLFEPLLGGGIITAIVMPLCMRIGATTLCILCCLITVACLYLGSSYKATVLHNYLKS